MKYLKIKETNLDNTEKYSPDYYKENGVYLNTDENNFTELMFVHKETSGVIAVYMFSSVFTPSGKEYPKDKLMKELGFIDKLPTSKPKEVFREITKEVVKKEIDKEFVLQVIATTLGNKKV